MPTKIIFHLPSFNAGGAQKVFIEIANYLNENNEYDVSFVVNRSKGEYINTLPSSLIIKELESNIPYLGGTKRFSKIIESEKPDYLFSTMPIANFKAVNAVKLSRHKPKLITRETIDFKHSYKINPTINKKINYYTRRYSYANADTIWFPSYECKDNTLEFLKMGDRRAVVIENPLDISGIHEKANSPFVHPFLENSYPVVTAMGRLTWQKGFDLLLESLKILKDKGTIVQALILGDGKLKDELKEYAIKLGIHQHIDLIGFQSNPYAVIDKSDLFVLSSRLEGMPNALLQAMACSKPVVATKCPTGPNEILKAGSIPYLTKKIDAESIATGIEYQLDHKNGEFSYIRSRDFSYDSFLIKLKNAINESNIT